MKLTMRFAALFCLASGLGFAETWSGTLVDSKCFAAEERNVSPKDTLIYVDRDVTMELRYCHPTPKTKAFAVVQTDWSRIELNSAANGKAADLVRRSGKVPILRVTVTGELRNNVVNVDSISPAH
jgi:hypothetical protein